VEIERDTVEGIHWQTNFAVRVDLGPGLTRREQAILFNSARRCEVHKLLDGKIGMMYELEERREEKK
jgi:hypothetical protein